MQAWQCTKKMVDNIVNDPMDAYKYERENGWRNELDEEVCKNSRGML